jgi:hypothetical protein
MEAGGAAGPEPGPESPEPARKNWLRQAKDGYAELVDAIVRPPRASYDLNDLGPKDFHVGSLGVTNAPPPPAPDVCMLFISTVDQLAERVAHRF